MVPLMRCSRSTSAYPRNQLDSNCITSSSGRAAEDSQPMPTGEAGIAGEGAQPAKAGVEPHGIIQGECNNC
eukprot:CAMPEP_0172667656 /NCGR_PEP_ID=MMETSP1074-20121228/8569_1 /TAXON_ID=2916 /ORGANISM="Ceratium fusus, Strain PA161109" /LENGTH=70 /DNA_ID=CAMNT_0013484197 /DNA_START=1191 /DNA_END=1404 /DNA_ORIENTATION=-